MFAAALIAFREVLEASLIIAIVMASTRTVPRRGLWVTGGLAGGLLASGIVAAFTTHIAALFDGVGQEIVNAAILFIAVSLIGWHIVWMSQHGRQLAADMKAASKKVTEGEKHMSVLTLIIGLAVMREGSEVVLMLQGMAAATADSQTLLIGAGGGVLAGICAGALMYYGFLTLPIGRVFAMTNGLLVLIAAGMAARGANFLAQADILPSFGTRIWDTSGLVPETGLLGQIMAALLGYIAQPSGIEILFYGLTLLTVLALTRVKNRKIVLVLAAALLLPTSAQADSVFSPYVVQGEAELENEGYVAHDRTTNQNNHQVYSVSGAYSPTASWKTEMETEVERAAGSDQPLRYQSVIWGNTVQLAEQDDYWIDPAFYIEAELARDHDPNAFKGGFIGGKTIGPFEETMNLFLKKEVGPSGNTPISFIYSHQAKYRLTQQLEPGFELFGETDGKDKMADQQLAIGPGLFGKIPTWNGQGLKYEIGYLFGATSASADGALRWKLEYEIFF